MSTRSKILVAAACAALALPAGGAPAPAQPQVLSKPAPLAAPLESGTWEHDHDAGQRAYRRRDYAEAERLWHSALRKAIQAHPHNGHPAAACHRKLAELYLSRRRYGESARHHQAYFNSLGTPMPHNAQVGDMASGYGICLLALNRLDLADAWLTRAMEILSRTVAADHAELGEAYARLARVRTAQRKYAEAHRLLQKALPIYEKSRGPDAPATLRLALETGDVLLRAAQADAAVVHYMRVLDSQAASRRPDLSLLAGAYERMAQVRAAQQRFSEAWDLLTEARLCCEKRYGPGHRSAIALDLRFASLFARHRRFGEAEMLCRGAIDAARRSFGGRHEAYAAALMTLGEVYRLQRNLDAAEPLLKSGVAIALRSSPLIDRSVARGLRSYALLLRDSYRNDQVPLLYAQAKALRAQHERPAVASAAPR